MNLIYYHFFNELKKVKTGIKKNCQVDYLAVYNI